MSGPSMNPDCPEENPVTPSPPLPPPGRLKVVAAAGERLVVFIPPVTLKGNDFRRFLRNVTAVLGIVTVFCVVSVVWGPPPAVEMQLILFVILGFFWLVALRGWWNALTTTCMRTLLSVAPARIVVQKTVFGRTWQQELTVREATECRLIAAFPTVQVGVYEVEVASLGQTLRLGRGLVLSELEWLSEQIEQAIATTRAATIADNPSDVSSAGMHESDPSDPQDPSGIRGARRAPAGPVAASDLPRESVIRVIEDQPDLLYVSFPVSERSPYWWVVPGLCAVCLGAWLSWIASGLVVFPILFGLADSQKRIWLRLTPDVLEYQKGWGPAAARWGIPIAMIEAVALERVNTWLDSSRMARRITEDCRVSGSQQFQTVCPQGDPQLARQVAGLLLWKLQEWGHPVEVGLQVLDVVLPPRDDSGGGCGD